eukprot:493188-Pyramimonas_sp.AAC.1
MHVAVCVAGWRTDLGSLAAGICRRRLLILILNDDHLVREVDGCLRSRLGKGKATVRPRDRCSRTLTAA